MIFAKIHIVRHMWTNTKVVGMRHEGRRDRATCENNKHDLGVKSWVDGPPFVLFKRSN
jgi:hypothetical protein